MINSQLNGIVILNFNDSTKDSQTLGFALMLNNDLSLLDSILFKNDEFDAVDSLLKSCFGSVGENLLFLTTDPNRLKEWYPESKQAYIKNIVSKFGLKMDRYFGEKGIVDQSYDTLSILTTKFIKM